jgi:haloacetate dehalogenase
MQHTGRDAERVFGYVFLINVVQGLAILTLPMTDSIFSGYENRLLDVGGETISVHIGGTGLPLLLLHGYPQNHAAWLKLSARLASNFTCVIADLPGYGASSIPLDTTDHKSFSKRRMAELLVSAMASLGFPVFSVMGHDRGARVAYRMGLDRPEAIHRLAVLEVIPTSDMWDAFNAEMAMKAYHWPFLAQPSPLPETLISCDPVFYLEWTLRSWSKAHTLGTFDSVSLESYRKQMREPARVHAMCEDYRAGATVDRALDLTDKARGSKIAAPLLFIWSSSGFPAATGHPLDLWSAWAENLSGAEVDCGHFMPEENPEGVLAAAVPFLRG